MLTATELAAAQATQVLTMTETCVRKRRTLTSDSAGGYTESWASASTVCRVTPMSANEVVLAGQQGIIASWKISLPAGFDAISTDRLEVGSRAFEVTGILGPKTRETARVVLCQER